MVSAIHRVLGVPELLVIGFTGTDKADNVRNAQVYRAWSEVALATVWRDTDDLAALLSILGPLIIKEDPVAHVKEYVRSTSPLHELISTFHTAFP